MRKRNGNETIKGVDVRGRNEEMGRGKYEDEGWERRNDDKNGNEEIGQEKFGI